MSLTLDPTLSDAQDGLVRKPIIELISTQPAPAIPFDGEYFNSSNDPEIDPDMIAHSSGRMVTVHIRSNTNLIFLCTDVNRIMWTETTLALAPSNITNVSLCELANANIGIILTSLSVSGLVSYLQYMVVQIADDSQVNIIFSPTTIAAYNSPNVVKDPFVILLEDGSFLLVYSYYDGTDYFIYKKTSSDFTSWSAEAAIALAGFESTYDVANPSLIQVASDDIILFLDHVTDKEDDATVTNISMLISDDNGITWGAPDQLTSYTTWGGGGLHPYPALTSSNTIKLAFHEEQDVLFMDDHTTLWQNDCAEPERSVGAAMHYYDAKGLCVRQLYPGTGKGLCGVTIVNTDDWEIDRNYNTGTVPDYSDLFLDKVVNYSIYGGQKQHNEGKYVIVSTLDYLETATVAIDVVTETVVSYIFKTQGAYGGITVNVTGVYPPDDNWGTFYTILGTWFDENTNRQYYVMGLQLYDLLVGYIDVTEPADGDGNYRFCKIGFVSGWKSTEGMGLNSGSGGIIVMPDRSQFCLYGIADSATWTGKVGIYSLASANVIKEYTQSDTLSFPNQGMGHCIYKNGHLYGMTEYSTLNGQENLRGLCDIDLDREIITYHRPSYATLDQYELYGPVSLDETKIIFAAWDYGVTIYDTDAGSWALYNNDSVPGFEPGVDYNVVSVAYNPVDKVIYTGSVYLAPRDGWVGVRAISEAGAFKQGKYILGTLGVDWDFTEPANLSIGLSDSDFTVAIDEDDILWSLWVRKDVDYMSIKWDKDQADLGLEGYLVGSVSLKRDIANVSTLNFSLTHGHLFDINNSLSALNIFSKKGRMVVVRFGENINGVEFWQNQGTFYIKNMKVSYRRGAYPTISIGCEDRLSLLEKVQVTVSEYYSDQYPEDLIEDMIRQFTDLEAADISINNFGTRHAVWHQVVDDDLIPAVIEVLDHFQQFLYMDVDNILTTREVKVSVDSVDHEYALDAGVIMNFSPDDNYSDFTNRVIVTGEARGLIEVLYTEELVANLSGSGGWWESGSQEETVYFSDDHEKKVRNVRLEIIKSIEDFQILWQESGGTEYVSYEDPNELYIIITIEFPSLQGVLIGLLAAVVTVGVSAIYCDYASETGGPGCGIYIMLFTILMSAVGYLLGQVATYDYEIWGRPVGEEKQTVQAIANDTDFQSYLNGLVVATTIDDPFCYSIASCSTVAEYELAITKAQRKRISFSKVAHLQDEVGDIIKIYHPYSREELNIFITTLTRRFVSGKSGEFVDQIEGWSL